MNWNQLSLLESPRPPVVSPPGGVLGEMCETFGWEAAVLLCRRFGGHEVYFPRQPPLWLVEVVGQANAEAWVSRHPGERFYIPKGVVKLRAERNRRIKQLRREGLTIPEIERRVGLCRSQIYSVLSSS